jgi:hypothetical protein
MRIRAFRSVIGAEPTLGKNFARRKNMRKTAIIIGSLVLLFGVGAFAQESRSEISLPAAKLREMIFAYPTHGSDVAYMA